MYNTFFRALLQSMQRIGPWLACCARRTLGMPWLGSGYGFLSCLAFATGLTENFKSFGIHFNFLGP